MGTQRLVVIAVGLFFCNLLSAQNYQAINGSMYAGSLSAGNNPASIVHVPYKWDITPLSIQTKQATNSFVIHNFSLLSSPSNAEVSANNGTKKRFVFTNQDIHLLNTRIKLNSKSAIGFGMNFRSYAYATTSQANYQDSSYSLADFFSINLNNIPLSANGAGSAWAEGYLTYSRTLIDDGYKILNAGVSLKLNRSVAGGYVRGNDIRYITDVEDNGRIGYLLNSGSIQYGYSSNFDLIDSNRSSGANTKSFLKQTYTGLSADLGIEYILLSDAEDADEYSYKTKLGISLMDLGSNRYKHSSRSRYAVAGKENINDTILENKFNVVRSVDQFNDSLATVADYISGLSGDFSIYKPTRLVVNIDQHVSENFFVNAELTVPLIRLAKNSLYIKDMNLLALTPRWETRSFGAYLPMQLNIRNQFWIGGAFRAGPLLLGTHNLANLFSKTSMQNGGFYLALTFRPGKNTERGSDDDADNSRQKNFDCPKF